jgi:hypothetical protein
LKEAQVTELEGHQYRAIKLLLKTEAKVSRAKLLACLGLETVRLRINVLSAKWLEDVKSNKGNEFLVRHAYTDFLKGPISPSSFHSPSNLNPLTTRYNHQPRSITDPEKGEQSLAMICKAAIDNYYANVLNESHLPIPPTGSTIAKTLYNLGIPRGRLRFVLLWLCDFVPYVKFECARCGEKINKTHLEACVLQTSLPHTKPGKRIDGLLYKAVSEFHAPSARLAMNILYDEITGAFPPLPDRL